MRNEHGFLFFVAAICFVCGVYTSFSGVSNGIVTNTGSIVLGLMFIFIGLLCFLHPIKQMNLQAAELKERQKYW